MDLTVSIEPDYNGSITITDSTYGSIDSNEYTNEDYDYDTELLLWDHPKWSDTCTLNIITLRKTNSTLQDPVYTMHKTEKTNSNGSIVTDEDGNVQYELLDSDSIKYALPDDGYYTVDHIVLVTKDSEYIKKIDSMLESGDTDTISSHKIYYTDGSDVYEYYYDPISGTMLSNVLTDLNDLVNTGLYSSITDSTGTEVGNPSGSDTISMKQFSVFSVDKLRLCYQKVACDILDHLGHCNEYYKDKRFIRDFLWMTLNVIDIYVNENLYALALQILEQAESYSTTYSSATSSSSSSSSLSCGCHS